MKVNKRLIRKVLKYDTETDGKVHVLDIAKKFHTSKDTVCDILRGNGRGRQTPKYSFNKTTLINPSPIVVVKELPKEQLQKQGILKRTRCFLRNLYKRGKQ